MYFTLLVDLLGYLFSFFLYWLKQQLKCDFTTQYVMSRTTRLNKAIIAALYK